MNDATELESSLTGAIDFFQNLRRKLGTLETDASAQSNQLHTLSATLVTLEQDRKTDRQMVANLSSGLVKMQADGRLLEQQLNAVETRITDFQQDQQQIRQTLSAVADDLRTQGTDWRQELAATLTQKLTPIDELIALAQTARRQLQTQQDLLDALTASATTAEQHLQAAQQDIAHLKGELDIQHRTQGDIAQIQQELQKHRDRLKHLETLIGKVSADTNSTRQILNVIQGDLTTQNDTLRELDQNWRDSLATYQDRLGSVEIIVAGGMQSATRLTRTPGLPVAQPEPAPASPSIEYERFETLEATLANTRDQYHERFAALEAVLANTLEQYQALARELNDVQTTLQHQDEHFAELRSTLTGPWDAVQQRLGELETAFESLHQSLETPVQADTDAALESLRQAIADQSAALEETQQLAWAQIQDLQQRLSEAEATLDHSSQTPEPITVNADTDAALESLRQAIADQSAALEETQQLAWAQIQDLQQRLSEAEAALDRPSQTPEPITVNADTDAALESLRQAIADQSAALEETQQLAWAQIQDLQQRLSEAEATLDSAPPTPEPITVNADTDAALESLRQAIADQSAALEETQQLAWAQIQDLQQRLSEAEATLDSAPPTPEPMTAVSAESGAALASLREDLSAQVGALDEFREALSTQTGTLDEFRETTHEQLTALSATLDVQQQDFQNTLNQIAHLQQDVRQWQQQPVPDQAIDPQRLETAELYAQEIRQDLETLQESVTALETRLSSQSQAFSGNFEQFRNLNADIHALQQQMARLDASPRQLDVLEQELATHEQDINQLKEVIEQIQADSQQMGDAIQQRSDSPLTEVAARLDEQQERWSELATTVETIRADSKASQETVVTMATNVAKRIHEIQNLLVATENTQSERLQEVEQKLIHLQAAFETLENQRKPRKWFSMPASLTSIMLTVGASGLAILAQVIWTID